MAEAWGGIATGGRTRSDPTMTISPPTRSTAPISTTASFGPIPEVSKSVIRKRVGVSGEPVMPYLGPLLGSICRGSGRSVVERIQITRSLGLNGMWLKPGPHTQRLTFQERQRPWSLLSLVPDPGYQG